MSDSVRPHRRQPTRLLCPWDSPGKNTGVGCHFLLQCMKVKSESEVHQSCPTLSNPMICSLPGSSVHGIFQARVLEWGAIAFSDLRVEWRLKRVTNQWQDVVFRSNFFFFFFFFAKENKCHFTSSSFLKRHKQIVRKLLRDPDSENSWKNEASFSSPKS